MLVLRPVDLRGGGVFGTCLLNRQVVSERVQENILAGCSKDSEGDVASEENKPRYSFKIDE